MQQDTDKMRDELLALRAEMEALKRENLARQEIEEALRQSESKLKAILSSTQQAFALVDQDRQILACNTAARKWSEMLFGQEMAERQSIETYVKDEYHDDFNRRFEQALQGGLQQTTRKLTDQAGQTHWFEFIYNPVFDDEKNAATCIAFSMHDVTRQKHIEAQLGAARDQFETILQGIGDIITVLDKDGRIVFANQAALDELGRESFSEIDGATLAEVIDGYEFRSESGDLITENWHLIYQVRQGESVRPSVVVYRRKANGEERFGLVKADPILDDAGRLQHIVVIIHDISRLRRLEKRERQQRAIAEALRDITTALTSTLNQDVVFDRILKELKRLIPYDAAVVQLIEGQAARVVQHQGYDELGLQDQIEASVLSVDETSNLWEMSESKSSVLIKDTRDYPDWVLTEADAWMRSYLGAPICLQGDVIGFLSAGSKQPDMFTVEYARRMRLFADQAAIAIDNAQLYETVVRNSRELEVRAGELEIFSHVIAHDLKTSLHVIYGYANILHTDEDLPLPADVREYLRIIEEYAMQVNRIVERLHQLVTLSTEERRTQAVDMDNVTKSMLKRLDLAIKQQGVSVEIEPLPPAFGQAPWVEEVIANLVENALKYIGEDNPAPRITLRGFRSGEMIRYEVEDNGIGVAPEYQADLFKAGKRFHGDVIGGAGMGLYIVQRIIGQMGGEVGVESTPGSGSTFWFTLPAADDPS